MLNQDPNSKCGILYIDDEEKALKYFRMAFAPKFEVFTASSGKEGIELLRKEASKIGIVISDQKMPEMQGAEVLGIVREEYPRIVRILTTAYSDLDSAILAVNKGHIYQYVVKPWEIQDLGMVLQRAADYYQVLSERNELLALKMTTLQRIICGDRLKWLLLADDGPAFRKALNALVSALPEEANLFPKIKEAYSGRDFDISALLKQEYHNAARTLAALRDPVTDAKTLAGKLGSGAVSFSGLAAEIKWEKDTFEKLFGLLLESEISEESILLFKFLVALAAEGGSLTVPTAAGPIFFQFADAEPENVIESLYEKFSSWDIAKLQ